MPRKIQNNTRSFSVVDKYIQLSNPTDIIFPSLDHIKRDSNSLLGLLKSLPVDDQNSILQQYNELLIYAAASVDDRTLLAPQLGVRYTAKNNLPVILYPKMMPLVERSKADLPYADLLGGWSLGCENVDPWVIEKFFDKLPQLCENYDLVEKEILGNLNNIGYDKLFSLRITDYGLCKDGLFFY